VLVLENKKPRKWKDMANLVIFVANLYSPSVSRKLRNTQTSHSLRVKANKKIKEVAHDMTAGRE
jgi:hypothetical protein